jgi:hypothetical protein
MDPASPFSVVVAMPAKHYMEKDPENGDKYRSRLFFDHPSGSVLASNFMRGHDVYFDVDEGRIGFAEIEICEKDPLGTNEPAQTGFYGERDYDSLNPDSYPEGFGRSIDSRGMPFGEGGGGGGGKPEVECGAFYSCCVTATCRSFVAVGYSLIAIVAVAALAAMRGATKGDSGGRPRLQGFESNPNR